MRNPIATMLRWWSDLRQYVILDDADSSVTLSKRLFRRMGVMEAGAAKVFMFRIPADGTYAFTPNPELGQETQLCDIQYNSRYRCIGFETLCPTVSRIYYDYGIPAGRRVKLTVRRCRAKETVYYKILPPRR